jgi:glycosyltransferase involved in cell wall biosynthesis
VISVVIPLVDERDSLEELHGEIAAVAADHGLDVEIIFIDDGSADGSWDAVRSLQTRDGRVRGLRFRRNFGKSAALSAGFEAVRGDVVITCDADLQDDPREFPRLMAELTKGLDVVSGWKRVRHDPWHKVWPSRLFNFMVSGLTGVRLHDHNCGLKCLRTAVVREIRLYGEFHRFIPVLASARGFRVGEIEVNHRRRRFGASKFGLGRLVKGLLDLLTVKFLTSFGRRPQHVLGTIGLVGFGFGTVSLAYLAATWVVRVWAPDAFPPLHARALLWYAVAALLFGTQLLSMGLLAELLTAHGSRDADTYAIAEEF